MDDMLGVYGRGDEMSPENLMIPAEYYYHSLIQSASAVNPQEYEEEDLRLIKAKISSHPSYSKLVDAYIECQKVGAPPEIVRVLDEIRRENDFCKQDDLFMVDPQLDHFMETYCDMLVKYKSDLSRPFDEAISFLTDIQSQLLSLCHGGSWEGEIEIEDGGRKREDEEMKEKLMRMYGNQISSLRLHFSKKKKNAKFPKQATQTLLAWWNMHSHWPYPTEADKIGMAETTGLDQKQINNWFINQRKRHWKSPHNTHSDVANTNNILPHSL